MPLSDTFSEICSRVQTRLIDVRAEVTAEIPQLVNEGIDALQGVHNWRCMQCEVQFITASRSANPHILAQIPSATTQTYAWKEPRQDPYYVMQIGDTRELVYLPNRTYAYRQWSAFNTFDKGPPRMLLLGEPVNQTVPDPSNPDKLMVNLNIEVYPEPDGNSDWNTAPGGEYRVNVPYWGYLPVLVDPSDTNWFTSNATAFLIDFATARGFMLDWDEARAGLWMRSAFGDKWDGANMNTLGGWARMAFNRDKSIAYAPGKTLVPRRDVFAPRDQWRQ